jgi:hypothetical protein
VPKLVAGVIRVSSAKLTESLARWPADYHIRGGELLNFADVLDLDSLVYVQCISLGCVRVPFNRGYRIESLESEAQRETSTASE